MKLLTRVYTVDSAEDEVIVFAVIEMNDEFKEYINKLQILFSTVKQFDNNLFEIRLWGCPFVKFYNTLSDFDFTQLNHFDENGYSEAPDNIDEDEESSVVEVDGIQLLIDDHSWGLVANELDTGISIATQSIPYILEGK